jgi:hypothetical protein
MRISSMACSNSEVLTIEIRKNDYLGSLDANTFISMLTLVGAYH